MAARRAGVAMIYQELSLAPDLSVADNILLGMEPARFGVIRARVDEQDCGRCARGARTPRHRTRSAGRRSVGGRSTARRDREGDRRWLPRAGARRADEHAGPSRRRAAVRADCPPESQRSFDRLHFALHRRGSRGLRSPCRVARRARRRRWTIDDGGGGDRAVDGRTRGDGSLPAHGQRIARVDAAASRSTWRRPGGRRRFTLASR